MFQRALFSKFSQIALVAARLRRFCGNFENTRENLSLILLGLMRLHILISSKNKKDGYSRSESEFLP